MNSEGAAASATEVTARSLSQWLSWQESLHPKDIELGLDRCRRVAERMGLLPPSYTVITVGGTNGKGSTVAMLERIYRVAGLRVATYTSPHLLRYNERIRIDSRAVDDERICQAFAAVEQGRETVPLTVFEFGTLAALNIFAEESLDIAILEVGMGGRLDAVNLVDADIAVIATLDIDHVEWLGNTREEIAREKAGIMRRDHPAVCSDPRVPLSLVEAAESIGAPLELLGQSFHFVDEGEAWTWWSGELLLEHLPKPALQGGYQLRNAAGVLKAVERLSARHPITFAQLATALTTTTLSGRFQRVPGEVEFILDVAHNAQALEYFVATLLTLPTANRTHVILGMLRTKDRASAMQSLSKVVDCWHLATVTARQGATSGELRQTWQQLEHHGRADEYPSIVEAYRGALAIAEPGDRVLVVGSFVTVGEVLHELGVDGRVLVT
ncbi:MAG: bifunctional tetrahydrofolate synthase/dihydrofolate synthase [Gammaproteobacteria bacterium]|nr:bifunctional tetrahydrofolate synthase/dihydrofolate synthase [Gammaproteobacteria bacterium]